MIRTPPGRHTRPTLARVREAIFNILGAATVDACFVDLFAGSGGVGLEALSRGAAEVIFVEIKPANCALIRTNLEQTGLAARARVWCADALVALRQLAAPGKQCHILFADPPYEKDWLSRIGTVLAEVDVLAPGGRLLVQVSGREKAMPDLGGLGLLREYRYGDTKLILYSQAQSS